VTVRLAASLVAGCLSAAASTYVAEDGDQRRATVDQVSRLQFDVDPARRRCNATIVMMDDRRDVALANNSKDIGYFHKSFALNYLYAQRHAMEFVIVRPTRAATDSWLGGDSGLCPAWCRVKILASLVASHRQRHSCHWVLYIDSDAYVREQHVDFLERLDTPRNADVQIAISREELPAGGFRSPRKRAHGVRVPSLNAGVLFVKATQWSSEFLAAWMRAASLPVCAPFRQLWPCEQQCFHELLRNRSLLPRGWRAAIATAPMQLFNSPWGQFIRHVWGGPGVELRRKAFDDELKVQGVWRRTGQMEALVQAARSRWIDMPC